MNGYILGDYATALSILVKHNYDGTNTELLAAIAAVEALIKQEVSNG